MKLTPRHLAAMYHTLASVPPLDRYKLASDARIDFKVTRAEMSMGLYEPDPHTISISKQHHKTYTDVMQTLAHEMCHLALERKGSPTHSNHCSQFNALAVEICEAWGWNFKEF